MTKKPNWISETEAANIMGLAPKYFRRAVQSGKYQIGYTRVSRAKIEYNKVDIENHKNQNAVMAIA
jgi:hypothetical protein